MHLPAGPTRVSLLLAALLSSACQKSGPVEPADSPAPPVYEDPLLRGAALELAVNDPELTDVILAGDDLLFAGQEQSQHGGVWSFDLRDPEAPVLRGRTDIWHIQRLCWDGERAYGTTRYGELHQIALGDSGPEILQTWRVGTLSGGLDCADGLVAVALGEEGGLLARVEGEALVELGRMDGDVDDMRLEPGMLWAPGGGSLRAFSLLEGELIPLGELALSGSCQDISGDAQRLALACGSSGVVLVERGEGAPRELGVWRDHGSARALSLSGDLAWVAAWGELIVLDISEPEAPILVGSEPASSAAMSVVAAGERAYVADWNAPFLVSYQPVMAPEVRLSRDRVAPDSTVYVFNDGSAPLSLGVPDQGSLERAELEPGGFAAWVLPPEAAGLASLSTNDPDEPILSVEVSVGGGLVPGADAPQFVERDLLATTWDLAALRGEVVFLGLFTDG